MPEGATGSLVAKKPFTAPVVEQLAVRVLVDSRYERFLPKASHPFVAIEHVGQIPRRQMTSLACEWGLSLHLESGRAGSKMQYMLDFGYTPEIILRNADLLDIDPAKIDGLILSHAHRDHFGGLTGFLMQHRCACAATCASTTAVRRASARSLSAVRRTRFRGDRSTAVCSRRRP